MKEVKKEEPEDWQSVSETFFLLYLLYRYNLCDRDAMNLCEYCVNRVRYCACFEYRYIFTSDLYMVIRLGMTN